MAETPEGPPPRPEHPPADADKSSETPASQHRGWLVETLAQVTRPARRLGKSLGMQIQRQLHPFRHWHSRRRVRNEESIQSVGFVCLGNICRSPYAEYRLKQLLASSHPDEVGRSIRVSSVGFIGPGRPSPEVACKVAESRGVDLEAHRSRAIDPLFLEQTELILVMTGSQLRDLRWRYRRPDAIHLGDLDPGPVLARDIPDPYGHPPSHFQQTYSRIDSALEVLAGILMNQGKSSPRETSPGADGSGT